MYRTCILSPLGRGVRIRERWDGWRGGLVHSAESASGVLPARSVLALEMALHEEFERRALEGELALLESRWREAEEIAGVADALPDDPLDELKR